MWVESEKNAHIHKTANMDKKLQELRTELKESSICENLNNDCIGLVSAQEVEYLHRIEKVLQFPKNYLVVRFIRDRTLNLAEAVDLINKAKHRE